MPHYKLISVRGRGGRVAGGGVEIVLCYPSMQMHTPLSLTEHTLLPSNVFGFMFLRNSNDYLYQGNGVFCSFCLDLLSNKQLVCLLDSK